MTNVKEHEHIWRDVYYGQQCEVCELFYPWGQAPWDTPTDEELERAENKKCWTCEVCGGEYWDGGTSCTCEDW